jgi:hypothetical protein
LITISSLRILFARGVGRGQSGASLTGIFAAARTTGDIIYDTVAAFCRLRTRN